MSNTAKQLLAKKRNWLKFRLKGQLFYIDKPILTIDEAQRLEQINNLIRDFIGDFDYNSKLLGLNSTTEEEREEKRQKYYAKLDRDECNDKHIRML
jgi:hypothetical protein